MLCHFTFHGKIILQPIVCGVKVLGANELVTKTKDMKLDTMKQFSLEINAALHKG